MIKPIYRIYHNYQLDIFVGSNQEDTGPALPVGNYQTRNRTEAYLVLAAFKVFLQYRGNGIVGAPLFKELRGLLDIPLGAHKATQAENALLIYMGELYAKGTLP